jgi:two-component system, chemotaxis family, protein-glutamate methylesterase/glutaminase
MCTKTNNTPVAVVILVASAGGLEPLCAVLEELPVDYPAAILVYQHLGGRTSVLPAILARRTRHQVSWAVDGERPKPHRVTVCPPSVYMELRPDGRCLLSEKKEQQERRFDVLLTSAAASYGGRALAVVLSGSGHDGAAGTAAMSGAGGAVIAESKDTAAYASMPTAAAQAGAVVLPVSAIGAVLREIANSGLPAAAGLALALEKLEVAGDDGQQQRGPESTVGEPARTGAAAAGWGSAAARGDAARRRAAELQRRGEELASGAGSSAQTVALARSRAEEAIARAETARAVSARRLAALEQAKAELVQHLHE